MNSTTPTNTASAPVTERKEYQLTQAHPEAIVIHCGDPRFQEAFRSFIHDELQLTDGNYVPIVVAGGAASLSEPMSFPKEVKVIGDIIQLLLDRHSIKHVVLINHEDCTKYEQMRQALGKLFLSRVANIIERQKLDLGKVAEFVMELAEKRVDVKLYYAKFANPEHTKAVFEEVPLK